MLTFNAVINRGYSVDTTIDEYTAYLPSSPTIGDSCGFIDHADNFDVNNLTIDGNGKNIKGSSSALVLSSAGDYAILTFIDDTQGWIPTG